MIEKVTEVPRRIEDRRQPTSMDRDSMVLRAFCPECKKTYYFIVTVTDAEDNSEVCRKCRGLETPSVTARKTLDDFIQGMRGAR